MKIQKCPATGKSKFPDEKFANKIKMRIWSHDPKLNFRDFHSYKCESCGFWHLGHVSYYQKKLEAQNGQSVSQS